MDKRKKYISPQTGIIDDCPPLLQASSSDEFNMVAPPVEIGPGVFPGIELPPGEAL